MKRSGVIKTTVIALSAALLMFGIACGRQPKTDVGDVAKAAGFVPGTRVISPLPDREWTMPSGDYANTRFIPLDQIHTGNVGSLRLITSMSTGILRGHEGGPLVVNSTMYLVTPHPNYLIAIDLKNPSGPAKWKYEPNLNLAGRASRVATS